MKTIFVCSDHFTGVWDFSWENFTILLTPGEMRGLAYIINSPIPGKTCFKLTSRHKKGLLREDGKKKMIFTSFLWQFPSDDTVSVDSHLHYSSCLFTFCYSKFLLPTGIGSQSSNFACILFWDSALHSLLPVFDVLSEQIVTSELLLRQCLSVFALPEMTFCLARRPAAWHCSGFLLPGSAIFFLSAEREKSL